MNLFRDDENPPYDLWPTPGGLVHFANTYNGDMLFWLPRGEPAEWPVAIWDRGDGSIEVLDCDFTDFLAGLTTGEIVPTAFPEDMLPCDLLFEPVDVGPSTTSPKAAASPWRLATTWSTGYFGGGDGVRLRILKSGG